MDDSDESMLVRHVPLVDESALGWIRPAALSHRPATVLPTGPAQMQMFVLSDTAAAMMEDPAAVLVLRADVDGVTAVLCALAVRPGASRRSLGARILSDVADFLRAAGMTRICADPGSLSVEVVNLLHGVGYARAADGRWMLDL
jgi:GNAT superfamily N-acetyltransferase